MIAVVIGGSAGSLDAVRSMLAAIPANDAAAFAIVIHIPPTVPSLLAHVLSAYTAMSVREAVDKLPLTAGTLITAPPDYHLLFERDKTISLSRDPGVHYSRPAIDPLFETAADAFGANTIGVLLTGSNEDGAAGVRAIRAARGRVAIQDPATASSPEMPTAGLAAVVPDLLGSPIVIGQWLARVVAPGKTV